MKYKPYCFVPNCKTGSGHKNRHLFRAPSNPDLLRKWQEAIGRKDKLLYRSNSVCSLHFLKSEISYFWETKLIDGTLNRIKREKVRLLKGSVPSIFTHLKINEEEKVPIVKRENLSLKPSQSKSSGKVSPEKNITQSIRQYSRKKRKITKEKYELEEQTQPESYSLQEKNKFDKMSNDAEDNITIIKSELIDIIDVKKEILDETSNNNVKEVLTTIIEAELINIDNIKKEKHDETSNNNVKEDMTKIIEAELIHIDDIKKEKHDETSNNVKEDTTTIMEEELINKGDIKNKIINETPNNNVKEDITTIIEEELIHIDDIKKERHDATSNNVKQDTTTNIEEELTNIDDIKKKIIIETPNNNVKEDITTLIEEELIHIDDIKKERHDEASNTVKYDVITFIKPEANEAQNNQNQIKCNYQDNHNQNQIFISNSTEIIHENSILNNYLTNHNFPKYKMEEAKMDNEKEESSDLDYSLESKETRKIINGHINAESEIDVIDDVMDLNDLGIFGIAEILTKNPSDQIIKCKYCNFETKHKNQLWGHMQIHADSLELKNQDVTLYKCQYQGCKFQTIYKYSMTKHVNTHQIQKYKCSKCSYVTLKLYKYESHVKSCEKVPEDSLLQCDQCDYKVKTQGLLLLHKRRHRNESELLKCSECDLTTMYASALKKHMEKHRRVAKMEKLFSCTKCSFRSPSRNTLMRHEKVHVGEDWGEGKYQCSGCSFQTMDLDELEIHMVEHKDSKLGELRKTEGTSKMYHWHCPECSFKTTVPSKSNYHKKLHIRQKNGETYKCEHCNYETIHKHLLKRHSVTHKNKDQIKTYPCDLCDYRAKVKDYLVRHKRTHRNKEQQIYKCTVCLFETIYKHNFREHLARHKISLVDVKKFLSDTPASDGGSTYYVSKEDIDIQNV